MKYIDRIIVNAVIHDFKQSPFSIVAKDQVFIAEAFQKVFVKRVVRCPTYIILAYAVPECRFVKDNTIIHIHNIPQNAPVRQQSAPQGRDFSP
jgi:hypothetical protein